MKTTAYVQLIHHKSQSRIRVDVPNDPQATRVVRQIPGRAWSQSLRCWHIPATKQAYQALFAHFDIEVKKSDQDWGFIFQVPEAQTPINSQDLVKLELLNPEWLKIDVPYFRRDWQVAIKSISGRRWQVKGKYWSVPYVQESIQRLQEFFGKKLCIPFELRTDIPARYIHPNYSKDSPKRVVRKNKLLHLRLNDVQKEAMVQLEERLLLKRYSWMTVKSYKSGFRQFLVYEANRDFAPQDLTEDHVKGFMLYQIREHHISESYQNQMINAIKFYFEKVLGRSRMKYDLDRPKKPKKLPQVLSEGEVSRLLDHVQNLKHKCILLLIYSGGLRISEVVNLQKKDILPERNFIFVKGGKGKKDRYTLLSQKVRKYLERYYETYAPAYWLFEGQQGGRYSVRSIQALFRRAVEASRVNPRATVHTLRHSFATHLLEKGVNLRYIQKLLGHESVSTTEVYTHITDMGIEQIESPLDKLELRSF